MNYFRSLNGSKTFLSAQLREPKLNWTSNSINFNSLWKVILIFDSKRGANVCLGALLTEYEVLSICRYISKKLFTYLNEI